MSFLSAANMCRNSMKIKNYRSIRIFNIKNYKKCKLKTISSYFIHVKDFSGNKSHCIYIADRFEKRLLNITQCCVGKKKTDNFRSPHQKYATKPIRDSHKNVLSHTSLTNSLQKCESKTDNFRSPHQKYATKPIRDSHKNVLSHKSLTNSLQKCESVAEQIEIFHSSVKLCDDDISIRYLICQELEKILKPYYISCSVCLLGSSINGFGLKGCDVDISLQYSNSNFNESSSDIVVSSLEKDTSEKESPTLRLTNAPLRNQLLSIKEILQYLKFEEPINVIPGRCPILNFYHKNLSCDLSINNSLALQSTKLMLLCSKLDERVAKLVRIIIYWAKRCKLVGGPVKFKSYSMFLLVAYFLQTRSPPVLPSVQVMFEKTDFLENLENWSYDVRKYISSFERSKNNQSIEDLLREFFFFYGNFDFSYIICPLNGCSVDRKTFAHKNDCENSFALNTICIQDPLKPTWNVTTEVNWKNCKNLLKALIAVCENYHNLECWSPGHNNWGLTSLIDSELSFYNLKDIKEFVINLPVTLRTPNESAEDNVEVLESAADSVKHILRYCLLFPCYQVDSNTNFSSLDFPQSVKSALQNEFLSRTDYSRNDKSRKEINSMSDISYVCITRDTWTGRNTFTLLTNSSENLLENEHMISKKMDLERGSNEKEVFYFFCECYTRNLENGLNLHIRFKPLNRSRFIPKLAIFLKEYMPKFMDLFLLNSQKERGKLILK